MHCRLTGTRHRRQEARTAIGAKTLVRRRRESSIHPEGGREPYGQHLQENGMPDGHLEFGKYVP